ncbi:MAG: right-handed parallel beta-helix repeat-containing protein [Promethearchaeota archaeon]
MDKKERRALIFLLLILIDIIYIFNWGGLVNATITGDSPPGSGDWIIENNTVVQDETLILNASIIIRNSANVTFQNTTLLFNSSTFKEIRINTTGNVKFINCTLRAYNRSDPSYTPYSILVYNAAKFTMQDSIVEDCGSTYERNILIFSPAQITNSIFNHTYYALYFKGLGDLSNLYSEIQNNTFINSEVIDIQADGYPNLTISDNVFYGNNESSYEGSKIINCTNVTFSGNRFAPISAYGRESIINSTNIQFINNTFDGAFTGVYYDNSSDSDIYGNQFTNCNYSVILEDSDDVRVYSNEFNAVYTGFYAVRSKGIDVYYNTFRDMDHSGVQIREGSIGCKIRDNKISGSHEYGIFIYYSSQTIISNNTIEKNDNQAIYNQNSNGTIITNNIIMNNGWQGIHCYDSQNITIEYNVIKENMREGILFDDTNNSTIYHNNITLSGSNAVSLKHSSNISVNDNIIKHNIGDGISIFDESLGVLIEDNIIGFNEGRGIYIESGSSATYDNNSVNINGEGDIIDLNIGWRKYIPQIIEIGLAIVIVVMIIIIIRRKK